MNKIAIGLLCILPVGTAFAACPDIQGEWAVAYSETYQGDTWAGIGWAVITGNKIVIRGVESYQGFYGGGTVVGRFKLNDKTCRFVMPYTVKNSTDSGVVHGVIVSANKFFFMISNPTESSSSQAVAERIVR